MRTPILLLVLSLAAPVQASDLSSARLWQERYMWDALLQARDRAARVSADPRLVEVVKQIAYQVAQQTANLGQIHAFTKGQVDNLEYAFSQKDPEPSLAVIQNNFNTLSKGSEQIRNNLFFLTVRLRIAATQALPDPKLTENAKLVIAQVQQVQLRLNALYADTSAVELKIRKETWMADEFFRYAGMHLLKTVVSVQDSVFAVYNASYELYVLSKE
ncbi:MAG: hypothetical protein CO113_07450 [Elusimicrobia bacterium CG_4_9_14_3_um_filter_62_55]|nr:MAG: hypothetical protein COR54_05800 [Elusimicrobia bacterium CG22_combo_CG10-13_8_21_14_all_63_91]PJA16412.1 MAG: hypothetical protein COX66_07395 [Elusimicrobia bacterium CG_4_10_14_0_2_um_filter_63_34]PJB25712.1 MAG: hypothetical protein CO113_07450 [Elusimicrobia bacterium CG_4_9_14_3_um_filter_62_55]